MRILNRRTYGLQLQAISDATHEIDWYTPRNMNVAMAMAREHRESHTGTYLYKIFNPYTDEPPIIFTTDGQI